MYRSSISERARKGSGNYGVMLRVARAIRTRDTCARRPEFPLAARVYVGLLFICFYFGEVVKGNLVGLLGRFSKFLQPDLN